MKQVPLTRGHVTLVDDEDYEWATQWKWCAHLSARKGGTWRAVRTTRIGAKPGCQKRFIYLSRALLGLTDRKQYAEHRNGDALDNRRGNLRVATNAQNQANTGKGVSNTSGFKGVYWAPHRNSPKKWAAALRVKRKKVHLGYFLTPQEAGEAYQQKAKAVHGEFFRDEGGQ